MIGRSLYFALALVALACSCGNSPGKPRPDSIPINPDDVSDFGVLYAKNCAGCHGEDGKGGAALALADPIYLSIADDSVVRRVTASGAPGTSMPAFAKSAGGMLTDQQIGIIVRGIRERWSKPGTLSGANVPPYVAAPGEPSRGGAVYMTYCSSCHGTAGAGGSKASSIVDGSFLALASDQYLRTIVIVGRPEFGAPDWRGNVPGKTMSPQDVSDVVAWLISQRPKFPGQPYPNSDKPAGGHL
jgi:cytochrome c oxidase cbb3-type subunit III